MPVQIFQLHDTGQAQRAPRAAVNMRGLRRSSGVVLEAKTDGVQRQLVRFSGAQALPSHGLTDTGSAF